MAVIVIVGLAAFGIASCMGKLPGKEAKADTPKITKGTPTPRPTPLKLKGAPYARWGVIPISRPSWCTKGAWTNESIGDQESVPACVYPNGARTYTGLWDKAGCVRYQPKEDKTVRKTGLVMKNGLPDTNYYTVCQ